MEDVQIREFDITNIEPSSSWIILGPPGVGKSSFVEDLVKYNAHKYPVARVVCRAPGPNRRYCKIFPPLFVTSHFDKDVEQAFVQRQLKMSHSDSQAKYCVYILDDIDAHKTQFRDPFFLNLFKQGSRHWSMLAILVNQYAIEFPPDVRSAASYVVIFRYTSNEDRKKIYNNYGGSTIFKSEKLFNEIMNACTGDHMCVVIKQNASSMEISDCVFYYQTRPLEKWRFGCRELRRWNDRRLAKNKRYDIS